MGFKHRRLHLVFLFILTFTVGGLGTNLLVILLEGGKILTGLGEFTFLHTLTDVPVNKGTLGVHEVELVVKTSPGLGNGGGVAKHAHSALDLGEVTTWNNSWWLPINTDLEASWAPVDELDGALGIDGGDRGVDIPM